MRLMGTRLPWCAVVFLAACHAGPGDFPGTYGQPRFVATMKASTGAMYSQDDRNETECCEKRAPAVLVAKGHL